MTGDDGTGSVDEHSRSADSDGGGTTDDWPVDFGGVAESLVTTRGPNDRWNVAPLGIVATDPETATTWGRTRTRINFERTGEGYVQFVTDPVLFVDAALSVVERPAPILDKAHAWVRVEASRLESGSEDGTEWVRWSLSPVESHVVSRRVPTLSRARGAILEASVAASRLGVQGYDADCGREIIDTARDVVDRTGGPREAEAFDRLCAHVASEFPSE